MVHDDIAIPFGDTQIKRSTNIKLLGVIIDEHLNFSEHISYLIKKISPKIALLHRLRQFLDSDILNNVYKAIIQSHFDYCISVWGNCPQIYRSKVQKLQNRSARAVLGNFDYTASASAMVTELGWMSVDQRFDYFIDILMYKCLHGIAPQYLISQFKYVQSSTRSSERRDLVVPHPNIEIFKRSFIHRGPKNWNDICYNIREASSINSFKSLIKFLILGKTTNK